MTAREELRREMTHNHLYMTDERAGELIDAALAEHAHKLAEQQRALKREHYDWYTGAWEEGRDAAAALIEPEAAKCSCGAPEGDDEEDTEIRRGWMHSRSCTHGR